MLDMDLIRDGDHRPPGTAGTARAVAPVALLAACLAVLVALASAPAGASTSIKIVVNNQPITSYDIAQRTALVRMSGQGGNPRRTAEDELINEALQMQEARRAGVAVSDGEVDEQIDDIARRVGASRSQLIAALRQQGVGVDTLRDRIRAQIAWGRLVSRRFRASGQVTEQDIVAEMRQRGDTDATDAVQYELEQVIVVLPEGASSGARNRARGRADSLRGRFSGCAEGLDFARGLEGVVVKPFGKRLESEVPPDIREGLEAVSVGRLTRPFDRPEGLVMFAVCSKETVRSTAAAMFEIEGDIRSERGMRYAQQYLRTLRRDALIERR